jgi:DNA-binding MarR family transcriptional regulator
MTLALCHVATLIIVTDETSPPGPVHATDGQIATPEVVRRVGYAWREIRRGATAGAVRDLMYGVGGSALEPGQMDALDVIILEEGERMGELAERLRIDPSTATRAVQRLIKDGLAERTPGDTDARVVTVVPTEKGRRIHAEVVQRRRDIIIDVIAKFPPEDRERLADTLEHFVNALDEVVKARSRSRR